MNEDKLDAMRAAARQLCADLGLQVVPYGNAWWITGQGVSLVVADLAGIGRGDLRPLPIMARKGRSPSVDDSQLDGW